MAKPASLRPRTAADSCPKVGWIVGLSADGTPLIEFDGNVAGPILALSIVRMDNEAIKAAVAHDQRVLLLFEDGDLFRPIIIGLIEPAVALPEVAKAEPAPGVVVLVDGQRVQVEGKDEVVLKCGEASITLRRNGKVVIRGTQIESRSAGPNRIKGASVQIN
jgi:hypothetical protein